MYAIPPMQLRQKMPADASSLKHRASKENSLNSELTFPNSRRAAPVVASASSSSTAKSSKRKPLARAFRAIFSQPSGSWDFPTGAVPDSSSPVVASARVAPKKPNLVAQAKRVVKTVRKKLTSKSPKEELPKDWQEWNKRYANYEIDLNDPPMPPTVEGDEADPFNAQLYPAPHPMDEELRQAVVAKLDLFGKRKALKAASESPLNEPFCHSRTNAPVKPVASSASSIRSVGSARPGSVAGASISPSLATTQDVASLENHPPFRAIVAQIRELFDAQVGMLTVIDDEQQLFLATGGMPEGIDSLPRSVTFCSHAILADDHDEGMVILDSTKDWRFANNVPTKALGARFYAGVPLLAPTFGEPDAPAVAIGTLCVVDVKPRQQFDAAAKAKLRELADQATKEIEAWVATRMSGKLERLESLYQQTLHITDSRVSKAESASLARTESKTSVAESVRQPSAVLPARPSTAPATPDVESDTDKKQFKFPLPSPPLMSLPPTPPESLSGHNHHHARSGSAVSTASTQLSSNADSASMISLPSQPPRRKLAALPVTEVSPVPACSVQHQKLFDASCRMLARSLNLSLVYVASIDFNSASPAASDEKVNCESQLRILASHGLPTPPPAFDSALHVKALRSPEGGLLYRNPLNNGRGYASGILISVIEARRVGFVIGGFTEDREQVIGEKERILFVRFAEKLEDTCLALLRNRM